MRVRDWLPLHLAPEQWPKRPIYEQWQMDIYDTWLDASPRPGRCDHIVLRTPVSQTWRREHLGVWCGRKTPCTVHQRKTRHAGSPGDVDRYNAIRAASRYRITIGGVPLGMLLELRTSRHAEQIMATLDAIADA